MQKQAAPLLLAIESSCDDTSAAVLRGTRLLSCVLCSQRVHEEYGGVVPELASRAHVQNIVPTVTAALKEAQVSPEALEGVVFTRGPGLVGSLLVGISFAKGFALAHDIPLIEVNHLAGHLLAPFIEEKEGGVPMEFPYLSLLVSGGHTQIVRVNSPRSLEILGETIDDAAGEAFDKCAKVMGLPYPGGPVIDQLAQKGNPHAFTLAEPLPQGLNFSFSGLKTSFLYLLRDHMAEDKEFIKKHQADLAASLQYTIVRILKRKLKKALRNTGIQRVALGGGVAANSGLRHAMQQLASTQQLQLYLPALRFTTDNAAMIGIAGYFKYLAGEFSSHNVAAAPRMRLTTHEALGALDTPSSTEGEYV